MVYGELTSNAPMVKELYQFYDITPIASTQCNLRLEMYWESKSSPMKILSYLILNRAFKKNASNGLNGLMQLVAQSGETKTT